MERRAGLQGCRAPRGRGHGVARARLHDELLQRGSTLGLSRQNHPRVFHADPQEAANRAVGERDPIALGQKLPLLRQQPSVRHEARPLGLIFGVATAEDQAPLIVP